MQAQPEYSPVFRSDSEVSLQTGFLLKVIVGLALLLPLFYVAVTTRLNPALETLKLSQTDSDLLSEPEDVGSENFVRLGQDERFMEAVEYTTEVAIYRLLAVAIFPGLIGLMAGVQGVFWRVLHRILFSLIGVLIAPVALALLWTTFLGPLWGRDPSPIVDSFGTLPLADRNTAPTALIFLDSVIAGGVALAVGGTAYMAVGRGRLARQKGSPGFGLWLLIILFAAVSVAETLVLPFMMTRGGPANSTLTFGLHMYMTGFQNFRMGLASAEAILMIISTLIIVLLIWLVLVSFRLRLTYTPTPKVPMGAGCSSLFSLPMLAVVALPLVGLVVWGHSLVVSNGGYTQLAVGMDWQGGLQRTLTGPLQAIWLVQLPIMYLAGLSLGLIRPLGRAVSNILFLGLLLLVFIPSESLVFAWFQQARESGVLATTEPLGLPWLVSGFALIVFKLFGDGAYEKMVAARKAGHNEIEALLTWVILPSLALAVVVGAVLTFASAQTLMWPLVVLQQREMFTLPLEMTTLSGVFTTQNIVMVDTAVRFIGLIALFALPAFILLQVFVLDRLAIIAGPPDETLPAEPVKTATKEDGDHLVVVDESSPLVYTR